MRAIWIGTVALLGACAPDAPPEPMASDVPPPHNTLTDREIADGWQLLFDGVSTDGWRGWHRDSFPTDGWSVRNGELVVHGSDGSEGGWGGDIVSEAVFGDFELKFDFLLGPEGNSGVFYRVAEVEGRDIWNVAPEFQVLDDTAYIEMGTMDMRTHLTGDNYDLHASRVTATKPLGEWNSARILVNGDHVEHWLNGRLTVSYEYRSDEWNELVAASKFAPYPEYGQATEGHIGIQDHGTEIRYRNIKIRPITESEPLEPGEEVGLFNGVDLSGWRVAGTELWYVEDGELVCESGPDAEYGYLVTEDTYRDFELTLEFKQEADGNSGVFFRSHVDGTVISGWQAEVAPPGLFTGGIYESYGRGWLIQPEAERDSALRMGEWNEMRIRVQGDHVTTWVNGTEMIDLTDDVIGEADGHIALQIHDGGGIRVRWRNLRVVGL